jgi:energy-converting hydrogenase B subunit D
MNIMLIMHIGILSMVAIAGAGVVFTRDPTSQIITVSLFGLVLALFFLLMQAPDVALSQVVVGAVALPLMVLLALAKIQRDRQGKEPK